MSNALTGYEKNLSEFTRDELREIAKTYGISLRQIIENKINKDSLIKLIEENELYKKANPKILQAQPTYNIIEKLKASDEILAKKYKEFGSRFVSQEWYRNAMFEALNNQPQEDTTDLIDTFGLQVGKFYFFSYSAKFPNRYPYWDRYPFAQILEVKSDGSVLGANTHYLNPSYRQSIVKSWLNSTNVAPEVCLHTYIRTNMSNVVRVPDNDIVGLSGKEFIVESFVNKIGQTISPNKVWVG
jgi:hypothetical protein